MRLVDFDGFWGCWPLVLEDVLLRWVPEDGVVDRRDREVLSDPAAVGGRQLPPTPYPQPTETHWIQAGTRSILSPVSGKVMEICRGASMSGSEPGLGDCEPDLDFGAVSDGGGAVDGGHSDLKHAKLVLLHLVRVPVPSVWPSATRR